MWELLLNSGTIAQHTSQHILFLRFNKINGGAFHSFLFKQPKPEHHKASLQQNRKTLIIAWSGFILFGWSHESSFWTVADHHLSVVVQWGVIWSRQWQRLLITARLDHNKGHQKQSRPMQFVGIALRHLSPLICGHNSSLQTSFCWDFYFHWQTWIDEQLRRFSVAWESLTQVQHLMVSTRISWLQNRNLI